jgi:hypothetical protein
VKKILLAITMASKFLEGDSISLRGVHARVHVCQWVCMCVCVWVRVGACGCVRVRAGACGCVRVRVGVRVRERGGRELPSLLYDIIAVDS